MIDEDYNHLTYGYSDGDHQLSLFGMHETMAYWSDTLNGEVVYDWLQDIFLARDQCRHCLERDGHWADKCPDKLAGKPPATAGKGPSRLPRRYAKILMSDLIEDASLAIKGRRKGKL